MPQDHPTAAEKKADDVAQVKANAAEAKEAKAADAEAKKSASTKAPAPVEPTLQGSDTTDAHTRSGSEIPLAQTVSATTVAKAKENLSSFGTKVVALMVSAKQLSVEFGVGASHTKEDLHDLLVEADYIVKNASDHFAQAVAKAWFDHVQRLYNVR